MTDYQRGFAQGYRASGYVFTSFTAFVINATNDKVVFLLQAPAADTITHLGFRYGARVGTPVQHKISLQGISSSGLADGTILGGGSPASGLFTPPASAAWDGTWQWVALDNSIALTRGQFVAIVIEPIGTPDGSNNGSFTTVNAGGGGDQDGFPHAYTIDGGGAASRANNVALWGMKSATRAYGHPYQSVSHTSTTNSGDETAARFSIPGPIGGTYKVAGIRVPITPVAAKSFDMNIYSGTTVIQGPVTFDGDTHATPSNIRVWELFFTDTNLTVLNFGQEYRIAFKANDALALAWGGVTVATASDLSAFAGGAAMLRRSTRTGGAWSDVDTVRMYGSLILDDASGPPAVLINARGLVQ